jgi:esterase/lipase
VRLFFCPFIRFLLFFGLLTWSTGASADGAWQIFPAANPASPSQIVVLIHGLNLKPERMDEIAQFLAENNRTVLRLSLTGHRLLEDGTREPMQDVTRALWLKETTAAVAEARRLAHASGITYSLAGFSLGGALVWDYLAGVTDQDNPPGKVLMIAPAIAAKWYARASRFLAFMPNLTIPSLSPAEFRAHRGTTVGGYLALLEIIQNVKNITAIGGSFPVTVIANPDDELVTFQELASPPFSVQFNRYEVIPFKKEKAPAIDKLPFHLLVDSNSMTPGDWEKFKALLLIHL